MSRPTYKQVSLIGVESTRRRFHIRHSNSWSKQAWRDKLKAKGLWRK